MARTRTLEPRLRRKRWERIRDGLFLAFLPFLMVLLILTMPVLMPFVAWSVKRDGKSMLAAAEATHCARCGRTLGAEAVAKADTHEAEHGAAMRDGKDWTAVIHRRVRILRAMCVDCRAFHAYDQTSRAFRLLPDERRFWR